MRRPLSGAEVLLELYPRPGAEVFIDELYGPSERTPPPPEDAPYVRVNMVSSLDGKATRGGVASGLGSRTDRRLMDRLRSGADAVMIGARTLRAERLTLAVPPNSSRERRRADLPPQPLAVIVGTSPTTVLPAAAANLLHAKPDNTLFLVAEGGRGALAGGGVREDAQPQTTSATMDGTGRSGGSNAGFARCRGRVAGVPTSGGGIDMRRALAVLREEFGVSRLLAEGGPRLNAALLEADLAQEVFVTLAPAVVGCGAELSSFGTVARRGAPTPLNLVSAHSHEHEVFLRYAVPPAAPAGLSFR